jgi:hypothetical protein
VSTRHWFRGRQVIASEFIEGRMVRRGNEWLGFTLAMRVPARQGASILIELTAAEFEPGDYGRYAVRGDVRVDGVVCGDELRLHDLGMLFAHTVWVAEQRQAGESRPLS